MTNYQQRESYSKNEKYQYEKPPEQKRQESWLQKVTTQRQVPLQASDFHLEYRKNKEDKSYPIKQANQIIRIKTSDGKE
jgi:hypothetical protein